jgi:hypothetical protein
VQARPPVLPRVEAHERRCTEAGETPRWTQRTPETLRPHLFMYAMSSSSVASEQGTRRLRGVLRMQARQLALPRVKATRPPLPLCTPTCEGVAAAGIEAVVLCLANASQPALPVAAAFRSPADLAVAPPFQDDPLARSSSSRPPPPCNLAAAASEPNSGGCSPLRAAKGAAGCFAGRAAPTCGTRWTYWCPTGAHPRPSAAPPAAGVEPRASRGDIARVQVIPGGFM